ncbi:MAG: M23 family metallopeptidase [Bacteroidetes bacterium]|nr:M23 family metallopeptidase [Bacteroidota bacterium]
MRKILLLFALFSSVIVFGQNKYYSAPVKIPMLLSGNFAELRSNHFHSGIDIKTQGVTGITVHSAADGFVCRIAVSPTGYGNVLYVNHPNGTTTVYGHLNNFRDDIAKYVKENQYLQKLFKVDLQVLPGKFPVKKDEIIAKSGDSGSSGGPHLHFEIRDNQSEKPLNPLKYGFDIKDKIPPKVRSLMIVPLSETSHVKQDTRKRRFQIVFYDGKYHIENNPVVPVYGEIGFAIEVNDYLDNAYNKCGIYSLQLTVDDELYFSHQLDQFSFDESRYINSHIDYETYIDLNRRFQKTWVEPGNKLSTYNFLKENGSFKATGNGIHKIQIQLKDTYGNTSTLEFRVKNQPSEIVKTSKMFLEKFNYKTDNKFKTNDIELNIPEGAMYSDLNFEYKTMPVSPGYYSEIHVVHKNTVPLHKNASIRIKPKNLPEYLQSKALLVNIDDKTGNIWSAGGNFDKGWITTTIRLFGHYAVKIDTISPSIKPLSIKTNNTLTEANRIRFKISDDLAGIEKIEGLLDGKWALFEYDAKNNLITHKFDKKRFEFNKNHHLVLTVSDYKNNITTYEATFWK